MDIGVISDTHGLLRPEALAALQGVALILHAGDIGSPDILPALWRIAPVVAVRGNNDGEAWAATIAEEEEIETAGLRILLVHDLKSLRRDPAAEGFDAVISGHSHKPLVERRGGLTYLNPGSAGPRRFSLPISLARMTVADGRLEARLLRLG
jgi:putative phosphoesterase